MRIQLSIGLLASDRPDTLKKCLDSLKPLLRKLACELIVVFTGQKQETLALIKQYTDHVIPFEWCDDFSKARNVSLEAANGEWFLFLDDDEWFESTQHICDFFECGEYLQYNSAAYIAKNYEKWDGSKYVDSYVQRMVKIHPELHFVGAVHEYFEPKGLLKPVKYLKDFVHHYGYVSTKRQRSGGRFNRNVPLLLEEIKKDPSNGKNYMQLAQEYRNKGDFKEAEKYTGKGLEVYSETEPSTVYTAEWWLMAQLPVFIALQGDKERGLRSAEKLLENKRSCEVVNLFQCKTIIQLSTELHKEELCFKTLQRFQKIYDYANRRKDLWDIQCAAEINMGALKRELYKVYMNGLVCASETEDYDKMYEILRMIPWDQESDITDEYYNHIDWWKEKYYDQNPQILECFCRLKSENVYVSLQKAIYAEVTNRQDELEKYYEICCAKQNECIRKALIEIGIRNGFDITVLVRGISLEKWLSTAGAIAQDIPLEKWEKENEMYQEALREIPLYMCALEQHILIRKMLEKVLLGKDLLDVLRHYCEITVDYYKQIYQQDFFKEDRLPYTPEICQFCVIILDAIKDSEENRSDAAIKKLRKALPIYPQMSVIVNRLTDYIVSQYESMSVENNQEFVELGGKIKQVVKNLIDAGEYIQAESVLKQLLGLLPEDLEVLRMKQLIIHHLR